MVFVKLKGNVWLEVIGDYNLIISRLHNELLHFYLFILNSMELNLDGSLWRNPILLGICGFIRNNFPVNITSAYFGSVGVWELFLKGGRNLGNCSWSYIGESSHFYLCSFLNQVNVIYTPVYLFLDKLMLWPVSWQINALAYSLANNESWLMRESC